MSNKTMSETLASNNNNFVTYDNLGDISDSLNKDRQDLFTMLWNQDSVIIYSEYDNWSEFETYCIDQIKEGKYPINPKHSNASFGSIRYIKWDALILVRTTSTIETEKTVTAPDGKEITVTVQEGDTAHYGYTLYVYRYNDDPSKAELEPVNCDDSMDAIYEYINNNFESPSYLIDLTRYDYIFNYKINDWSNAIRKAINDNKLPAEVLPTSSSHPSHNATIYYKCRQYEDDGNQNTQIVYVRSYYHYSGDDSFGISSFTVFEISADVGFTDLQMDAIQNIIDAPAQ